MTLLNNRQIECLNDAIQNNGSLSREKAVDKFQGADSHHANTVASLIKKGCFIPKELNDNGYPILVRINVDNYIVKHVHLIGKKVSFVWGNYRHNDIMVTTLGIEDNKLFCKCFLSPPASFFPVESITKVFS